MPEGIRRDALPSGIFFSKLLVFGVRDKFHAIFTTPNFRIFKSAARYADRAEIDPGPRDSQKRKIGLPICRNIAVFSVFAFFSEKTNCRAMALQTLAAPIARVSCRTTELKTVLHIEYIFCSKCSAVCKLIAIFLTFSILRKKFAYSSTLWRRSVLEVQNCIRTFQQNRYFS